MLYIPQLAIPQHWRPLLMGHLSKSTSSGHLLKTTATPGHLAKCPGAGEGCDCEDSGTKTAGDATITISGSQTAYGTSFLFGSCSPPSSCPDVTGSYVVSCNTSTTYCIAVIVCAGSGSVANYWYQTYVIIRYYVGNPLTAADKVRVQVNILSEIYTQLTTDLPLSTTLTTSCDAAARTEANRMERQLDWAASSGGSIPDCSAGSQSWDSDSIIFTPAGSVNHCDISALSVSLSIGSPT
jgi:hypothetical protein